MILTLRLQGVEILSNALRNNHTLQEIILDGNRFGDDGLRRLAESVQAHASLTVLNLANTGLSPIAGGIVADIVADNRHLQTLNVDNNHLADGAWPISESLQHSRTLVTLSLRHNDIPDSVVSGLQAAARDHATLKHLDVSAVAGEPRYCKCDLCVG